MSVYKISKHNRLESILYQKNVLLGKIFNLTLKHVTHSIRSAFIIPAILISQRAGS